ncbi:MAG: Transport ATP-binding protein CydD [Anaerolineae bacterium]|nr:MAG: Transport ATP-binding protein CydD [Anaerolineae bacterium]
MLFERSLLQQGQFGKWLFTAAAVFAVAGGILALFQAQFFSHIIHTVFLEQRTLAEIEGLFLWLGLVLLTRGILLGGQELAATHSAFQIKQAIRERLIDHLSRMGYLGEDTESSGEVSQVIIEGVDALEPYFSQYLPQAVVAFLVPPILCLAVFLIDPLSGFVFLVTAPLIPFFMRLIADVSERQTQQQWGRLSQLSAFLFDALQGLPTIKRLGKSAEMAERLAEKGDEYRRATLETLRTTFLSALVMEMLSTLSTAVVAVQVGLRLLYGWIPFEKALFVLVIAPEFYLPLRLLGQRFHAGMSGVTAWKRIQKLFEKDLDEPHQVKDLQSGEETGQSSIGFGKEIVLQNVTFAFPERRVGLQNINARLQPGTITVLVGASGAGKTTLLNLLLRLIRPQEGKILVDGKPVETIPLAQWWDCIGVAPQRPFLFQGTVRENIAFAKPHATQAEIEQAAKMAYADEFIVRLPQGYETRLGENGYGLSAGEKQRLILARAYLKDAPLLILDESTANVDPQSIEKICHSLKEHSKNKAILIVSHQPQIWEIGQRFWVLKDGRLHEMDHNEFESVYLVNQADFHKKVVTGRLQSVASDVDRRIEHAVSPGISQAEGMRYPALAQPRISTQTSSLWKPWLLQLWSLRAWIALAVLLGWAAIFSNVGLMSTSAYIISFAALQPSIALLQTAIVGVRFFGISRGVFRYLERLSSHRVTLDLLSRMRVWFYWALELRVPQIFGRYGSGELLSRLIGDIASLEPFYVRAIAPLPVAALIAIGVVVWFLTIQPALAWVAGGFYLLAGLFVLPVFYFVIVRLSSPNNALRGQFSERLVVFLQGLVDLKVNRRLAEFQHRVVASARKYGRGVCRLNSLMSLQGVAMNLVAYCAMWLALWIATPLVKAGAISGLSLAGLGLGVLVSFEAFLILPQAVQYFVSGKEALLRLSEIAAERREVSSNTFGSRTQTERFEIKFDCVHFDYRAIESNLPAWTNLEQAGQGIKAVSFTLGEGQRLGIVGRSGSGKTTLVYLLLGLFEPQSGAIYLDGKDLSQYDLSWWRSCVASCTQDDYLFQTSLRENLLFLNPNVSQERLWQALEAVRLADFVRRLPQGLETQLGEHGRRLSGGERQRLLLARTLLRESPMYIFDEPTANLDLITAKEIVQNLISWADRSTIILISHQAIGFEQMDEILVFDQGCIIGRGKHQDLLDSNEYYAQLYRENGSQ